jgi:hypothetical protein
LRKTRTTFLQKGETHDIRSMLTLRSNESCWRKNVRRLRQAAGSATTILSPATAPCSAATATGDTAAAAGTTTAVACIAATTACAATASTDAVTGITATAAQTADAVTDAGASTANAEWWIQTVAETLAVCAYRWNRYCALSVRPAGQRGCRHFQARQTYADFCSNAKPNCGATNNGVGFFANPCTGNADANSDACSTYRDN